MPSVSSVTKVQIDGGSWFHPFGGVNTNWLFEQRALCGNFYLGLQAYTGHIFQARIPRGAVIESAVMRVWAFQNSAAAAPLNTNINSPVRNDGSLRRRALVNSTLPFLGWRPGTSSNANMTTVNPGLSVQQQTSGGASNGNWTMRQLDAMGTGAFTSTWRDRMAQKVTPVSSYTIGGVIVELSKAGAPAGSVRLKIMSAATDGGEVVPSETVLATSVSKTFASIAAGPAGVLFNFTGIDQITLNAGTDYFIVVEPDNYAANNTDNLRVHFQYTFLTPTGLWHYGTDKDLVWQHYPGLVDISSALVGGSKVSTDVVWPIPRFFTGVSYDTPDISAIVQAQVNAPEYIGSDEAIIVTTDQPSQSLLRVWRGANYNVDLAHVPELRVTWRPPRRIVI